MGSEMCIRDRNETREEWILRIRNSARGYKASFTTTVKTVLGKCKFVANSPSDFGIAQLKGCVEDLGDAIAPLKFKMQELMASATVEQGFKDYQLDLESYMEQFNENSEFIMAAIATAEASRLPKAQVTDPAQAAQAAAQKQAPVKANSSLPKTLQELSLIHI